METSIEEFGLEWDWARKMRRNSKTQSLGRVDHLNFNSNQQVSKERER